MALLTVENLTVTFPSRHGATNAIENVSIHVEPGEILGMVGESGAGKSMTGAAIIGLLEPPGHISGGESGWRASGSTTCRPPRCAKSGGAGSARSSRIR
jgi:ABC-type glutathione transport system ATPase component